MSRTAGLAVHHELPQGAVMVPDTDPGVLLHPIPPVPGRRVRITTNRALYDLYLPCTVELLSVLADHIRLVHYQPGRVAGGAEQELKH